MANNKGEDLSSSLQDNLDGIKKVANGIKKGIKGAKKAEATKIATKAIMAAFQKIFMLIFNLMGGWIVGLIFLVLIIASLACGAFNEALDINHYARDESVKAASTNGEDRPAMEEEEIVNGFTVIRKTVSSTIGLYSTSSSSSSSDSADDLTEMDDSQKINYLVAYFSKEENGSKITQADEYRITDEGGIIWTDPETNDEYEVAKILASNGSPGFDFIPNYAKDHGFTIEQQHTNENKVTYFIDSENDKIYWRYHVTKNQDGKDVYAVAEVPSTDDKYTLGIGDKVIDYVSEVASNTSDNISEAQEGTSTFISTVTNSDTAKNISETVDNATDTLNDLTNTDAENYSGGMNAVGSSVSSIQDSTQEDVLADVEEIKKKEEEAKAQKELEDNSVMDSEALLLACFQEVGYIPDYEKATRYTDQDGAWCADFVKYIFTEIGLTDIIPTEENTRMASAWVGTHYADDGSDSYTPTVGAIVTYSDNAYNPNASDKSQAIAYHKDGITHVGIVVGYDGNNVYTIEGNTWGGYDLGATNKNPIGTAKATEILNKVNNACSQIDSQGLLGTIHGNEFKENNECDAGVYFKIQSKTTMKGRHACYLETDVSGAMAPTTEDTDASAEYDSVWVTCAYDVYDSNYEALYAESLDDLLDESYLTKIKGLASIVLNGFSNFFGSTVASIKEAFGSLTGVDLKLYERTVVETPYTIYSEVEVDGETLYVKSGIATTTEEKTIDSYRYVKSIGGQAYYTKDGTRTITPTEELVETGEVETVKGFAKKGIFLQSLGLEPYGPYLESSIQDDEDSQRSASGMTNLEYADYLYDQIIETLDLPADSSSSSGGVYAGDYIWPIASEDNAAARAAQVNSLFGWRVPPGTSGGVGSHDHRGIDIQVIYENVYAITSGTVVAITDNGTSGYGKRIDIKNDVDYMSYSTTVFYAHLSEFLVSKGDHVEQGDVIAISGDTGNSGGPHLHLGVLCQGYISDIHSTFDGELDPLYLYPPSYVYGYSRCTDDDIAGKLVAGKAAEKSSSTASVSDDDFDKICAIVCHESGGGYESALAVMSCVMNRVDAGYASTPLGVLTAPGQFSSYLDGYYIQFLNGKYTDDTKRAVTDCLNGKRNHSYLNFNADSGTERIPATGTWANWYY